MEGTIRAVSEETRAKVHEGVQLVVAGIAAAHNCTAETEINHGYPVTEGSFELGPHIAGEQRDEAVDVAAVAVVRVASHELADLLGRPEPVEPFVRAELGSGHASRPMGFESRPTPSISTSTLSPATMKIGG